MSGQHTLIGEKLARVDGVAKATGQARFTGDIRLPRMVYGKILRSPHPHAEILGIDTSRAEKMPGVVAVITAKDIGEIRHGTVDNPYNPSDEYILATRKVRYIGDEVAAVAAVSEDIAEEALRQIKVDYRPLRPVFDIDEAMQAEAPVIHEPARRQVSRQEAAHSPLWQLLAEKAERASGKKMNNVAARFLMEHGDLEAGFKEADHIREDRFVIPATAHAPMETHLALASYSSEGLNVWLSHMGGEVKRYWLARTLGEPLSKVRVLKTYIGGAFGGKVSFFPYEFLAAYLSKKCQRPVLVTLSLEEVLTSCKSDHPMIIELRTGVKKDGRLVAQHMRVLDDCGAYRGTAPIALFLTYLWSIPIYQVPNTRHEGIAVYTNKSSCGAKRGHGAVQARFAVESQMDMIAGDLGLDPVELRLKNVSRAGDRLPNGDTLHSCGLADCIEKAVAVSGWKSKHGKKDGRGMGIAAATMFTGTYRPPLPPGSNALVKINADGSATLYSGSVEFGQGSETAVCQIAAAELGISPDKVNLVSGDTELCPADVGNFLSNGVRVNGQAVRRAAADARRQLLENASRLFSTEASALDIRSDSLHFMNSPSRLIPLAQLVSDSRRAGMPEVVGKGFCPMLEAEPGTMRYSDAYSFTVAVADVQVDKDLGKVKINAIYAVSDAGVIINPQGASAQLEGQAIFGQGDALFEEILRDEGQVMNPSFLDYKLPGSLDACPVETHFVETFEPKGAFGAKEIGEGSRGAIAPAIANAIYDATGIRIKELPVTPERLMQAFDKSP